VYGSRASSAAASARIAPVYAASVCASASATDAINALNVSVSASTSRLEPVIGSRAVTSCEAAMTASDVESRSIGSVSSRASQKLPMSASAAAPIAMNAIVRMAARCVLRDNSSIDPRA